jgi:hypothetical protein
MLLLDAVSNVPTYVLAFRRRQSIKPSGNLDCARTRRDLDQSKLPGWNDDVVGLVKQVWP